MMLPLTTPRLLLRRFRTEDLPTFSHYRNLPEVARFQSWTHYGMTEATAFYEQQRSQAFAEDESWFQLAVEIRANGALAGDVGIHFRSRQTSRAGDDLFPCVSASGVCPGSHTGGDGLTL